MWPRPQGAPRSPSTAARTEFPRRSTGLPAAIRPRLACDTERVVNEPGRAKVTTAVEMDAMRRAIDASRVVVGATSPNPPVGAVVLDAQGEVAGVGATSPVGGPHAEVHALDAAGARATGGTLVV